MRWLSLLLIGCNTLPEHRPNIVVIVIDDIGVEQFASYDVPHGERPSTPVLDALAAQSVQFDNAYAMPVCSATRFAALTGRYGRRVGLGKALQRDDAWELPTQEVTLPEELAAAKYNSVAIGKWHLARNTPNAEMNPLNSGFDHHDGPLGNSVYFDWLRTIDGRTAREPGYTTSVFTDAALDLLPSEDPLFLWLAYNAAHAVTPAPPPGLNARGVDASSPEHQRFLATVEALDTEIGRFLDAVDEDTIVVVVGDNGSAAERLQGAWAPAQGKGSVYESGTRVPLWVRHPDATPGRHAGLVHVVDLLPTVLEWVGLEPSKPIDGVSFAQAVAGGPSRRTFVYTERFVGLQQPYELDDRAVRGLHHKVVERDGMLEFFDVLGRSDDGPPVQLEDPSALLEELERLRVMGSPR